MNMTRVSENKLHGNEFYENKPHENKLYEKKLPADFIDRMKKLLGDEYAEFISGYERKRFFGLRYNPLKSGRDDFLKRIPFALTPVKWCEEGFYYDENDAQPGKHAFHEAGVYYIQEPSAMAAAEALEPKPGEKILDLCAAPGGKTTHIAGKMMGKGLLVSNEIVPERARILSQNVERMGIANAVVCNETPDRLAEFFPQFFDRILVDAPCSGEGMFRKDETAIAMWSLENVKMCAGRQLDILEQAVRMLKAGGVLVYSTCTFSPEENEDVISEFIKRHEEFTIEETRRLWPHKIEGEGHFIARLRKMDGLNPKPLQQKKQADADGFKMCREFLSKELGITNQYLTELEENGRLTMFGGQIYLVPSEMIPLQGVKVIRPGLHLGTDKKNRFEPSHALALFLSPEAAGRHYEMTADEAEKYLRGETFACDMSLKGWMLLTIGGYSIGFGKAGGGQMKNHYPKGLRKG